MWILLVPRCWYLMVCAPPPKHTKNQPQTRPLFVWRRPDGAYVQGQQKRFSGGGGGYGGGGGGYGVLVSWLSSSINNDIGKGSANWVLFWVL